ncbi:MAG: hypothetical protein H6707_10210 [Deltaproteobacteria bacterium]|nr:hypothetical protein [Deltaproteobacteria bacterium]
MTDKALGVAGVCLVLASSACGATSAADRETALPTADATAIQKLSRQSDLKQAFAAEVSRGDRHFTNRHDRRELERAIAAYQSATKLNPKDGDVWTKLSRATYLLADGFISFDIDKHDEAKRAYLVTHERGIVYAKRAMMAISPEFRAAINSDAKFEDAVRKLDRSAVPAMYWFCSNYGQWAASKGLLTIIKYKEMIKSVMGYIHTLDPDHFFGGADRYFGAFWTKTIPSDLDKSKSHFEASLKRAPNYFGTKVLMASYYAKKAEDRALFERLLKEVIDGDPNAEPRAKSENLIAQQKARKLLSKIDDFF